MFDITSLNQLVFFIDCYLKSLTDYHQELYYNSVNFLLVFVYETRFKQGGIDEVHF